MHRWLNLEKGKKQYLKFQTSNHRTALNEEERETKHTTILMLVVHMNEEHGNIVYAHVVVLAEENVASVIYRIICIGDLHF